MLVSCRVKTWCAVELSSLSRDSWSTVIGQVIYTVCVCVCVCGGGGGGAMHREMVKGNTKGHRRMVKGHRRMVKGHRQMVKGMVKGHR